jgi:predicted flap endonuclease-1-like 5' DNA nuclease
MSSTTSQKFRDFTGEPLKDKLLSEIPGLGPKLASNLEGSGITKVCFILFLFFFDD